jgi:hypothetical protein
MNKKSKQIWQDPSLREYSARRSREVVDGLNLQEVEREGILAFSLCKDYSTKQHRRINRLRIGKTRYGHGKRKLTILGRYVPTRKQLIIKQTFDGGVRTW